MAGKLLMVFGVALFLIGSFFILDSIRFNGFAILDDVERGAGSIAGIILIVLGIVIVKIGEKRKSIK